jgi:hypothetical protein
MLHGFQCREIRVPHLKNNITRQQALLYFNMRSNLHLTSFHPRDQVQEFLPCVPIIGSTKVEVEARGRRLRNESPDWMPHDPPRDDLRVGISACDAKVPGKHVQSKFRLTEWLDRVSLRA